MTDNKKFLLSSLKKEFIDFIKFQKRYSEYTTEAYSSFLEKVLKYWSENNIIYLHELNTKIIEQTMLFINQKDLTRRTLAQRSNILKSFFKYVSLEHDINLNAIRGAIPSIRFSKKLVLPVEIEVINKILNDKCFTIKEYRDRAILSVFYSSAIRVGELVDLNFGDFDAVDKKLFIQCGKGGKARYVPMTERCIKDVQAYIKKMQSGKKFFFMNDTPLFLNRFKERMTTRSVEMVFEYLKKTYKIKAEFTPHIIRHTVAVNFLKNGADITVVQRLLGHKSILATQQYANINMEDVILSYHKAMRAFCDEGCEDNDDEINYEGF